MNQRGTTLIELLLLLCAIWLMTWCAGLIARHFELHLFLASGIVTSLFIALICVFELFTKNNKQGNETKDHIDD